MGQIFQNFTKLAFWEGVGIATSACIILATTYLVPSSDFLRWINSDIPLEVRIQNGISDEVDRRSENANIVELRNENSELKRQISSMKNSTNLEIEENKIRNEKIIHTLRTELSNSRTECQSKIFDTIKNQENKLKELTELCKISKETRKNGLNPEIFPNIRVEPEKFDESMNDIKLKMGDRHTIPHSNLWIEVTYMGYDEFRCHFRIFNLVDLFEFANQSIGYATDIPDPKGDRVYNIRLIDVTRQKETCTFRVYSKSN